MPDKPEASKRKSAVLEEEPSDVFKMAELGQSSKGAEPPTTINTTDHPNHPETADPPSSSGNPPPAADNAASSNGSSVPRLAASSSDKGKSTTHPNDPEFADPQSAAANASSSNTGSMPRLAGSTSDKGKDPEPPAPPAKNDEQGSSTAIGAASDDVVKAAAAAGFKSDGGPVCVIILLVPSGKKHPYKIDEKYLAKRNVDIPGTTESGHKNPFSISVYTLKELILREWRDDWDPAPPSPEKIRLIHFGHMLQDNQPLNKYRFSADTSNVVHMTIKPLEVPEEEETKGVGKSNVQSGDDGGGDHTSRCCIIL